MVITPDEPITEDMRRLPDRITEVLDYVPGHLVVIRYIRHCYIKDVADGLHAKKIMAAKPERPINRCLADAALLAQIICDKYCDHLPLYRQLQRFERSGVRIGSSTFNSWVEKIAQLLTPLYDLLQKEVLSSNYIRIDEPPIKVLDREKKKNIHQGYLWYYQSGKACFIQYHHSRGSEPPDKILAHFKGKIQTDGYGVYDHFEENEHMTLFGCWAHARRKIFEVSKAHPSLTEAPLEFIGELYLIEKQIKKQGLDTTGASLLRRQKAGTPLMKLKHWMHKTKTKLKPKMKLYKAIEYIQKRWQKLIRYLWHGEVQIDNNLIENAIRSAALGRKVWVVGDTKKSRLLKFTPPSTDGQQGKARA
ncbi:TnpC protein [Microscilla marina ATCC 23134]|uniref:TnpC protein n=1 Tax=Microscilla marina ATCC 23134 TaxID=313606 RepID=A1ZX30_MICM2|nr:TnpC protein [Microscilla marina ATCC 23134]